MYAIGQVAGIYIEHILDFSWLTNQNHLVVLFQSNFHGDYLCNQQLPANLPSTLNSFERTDLMTESKKVQLSDAVETARRFTEQVPHNSDLGMQVVSVDGSKVCMRLTPQAWMFSDIGRSEICTSILYSLADSASGLAVFAEAQELTPIATLSLHMDYMKPAYAGRALLAVAICRHLIDDIAFIHCDIFSEGDSQPVATGSATFIRNTWGQRFKVAESKKEGYE